MRETREGGKVLGGFAAPIPAAAFDPPTRTWISEAHTPRPLFLSGLDGHLVLDDAWLTDAADDLGRAVVRAPVATLKPRSVKDIAKAMVFANLHGIKVAMRCQGHPFLDAPATGAILIDSRTLTTVHALSPNGAKVDVGVRRLDVLAAAAPYGLTPPVHNEFMGVSVGRTLSSGGFSCGAHRHGLRIDDVLELEVVTGVGHHLTCSRTHRRDLFHALLGGLGQAGVIVRATLRLVPAHLMARSFKVVYTDLARFAHDQRAIVAEDRFDHVMGRCSLSADGWIFTIEAVSFFDLVEPPDDRALVGDLAGTVTVDDTPYLAWTRRARAEVVLQKRAGVGSQTWVQRALAGWGGRSAHRRRARVPRAGRHRHGLDPDGSVQCRRAHAPALRHASRGGGFHVRSLRASPSREVAEPMVTQGVLFDEETDTR